MTELDRIQSSLGTMVIPHNAHVYRDWVVTSYYTSGVQIVDAKYPELLVEVGYYDTSPNYTGNGFNGNWGVYPYFDSQTIVCSDIEEGLYVLNPTYVNASRVHIQVVDSITGVPLSNALINIKNAGLKELSSIDGLADLGTPSKGKDSLSVTLSGLSMRNLNTIGFPEPLTPCEWLYSMSIILVLITAKVPQSTFFLIPLKEEFNYLVSPLELMC